MRLRILSRSLRRYLLATMAVLSTSTSWGGTMAGDIGVQVYRDFAGNIGRFQPYATDITIYNKAGKVVGVIPVMPDFSSQIDRRTGEGNLAGAQNWITTCAHDYNWGTVSFGTRHGAVSGSVYFDNYQVLKNVRAGNNASLITDTMVGRLNKLATDAVAWNYCTDPDYMGNTVGLQNALVARIGAGTQWEVYPDGTMVWVTGGYGFYTAGLTNIRGVSSAYVEAPNGMNSELNAYRFYNYSAYMARESASNPLPMGTNAGDSGSPIIVYNEKTKKWEYLAGVSTGTAGGYGNATNYKSSYTWAMAVQELTQTRFSATNEITGIVESAWRVTSNGAGLFTFTGQDTQQVITTDGLANGMRGDTSTIGTRASNDVLYPTKDWVFGGGGVDIVIEAEINTGAGALYFTRQEGAEKTYYSLSASQASFGLNSAGYSIEEGAYVTTSLLGKAGDEWRVVGVAGDGGELNISGNGINLAHLNLGVGAIVYLNQVGGAAAQNVKINTGAAVVLGGSNQIGGDLIFGVRGGVLDLNGHDFERNQVHALDRYASIANFGSNVATYNFNGTGSHTYVGGFIDGGVHSKTGTLNVSYNGNASSSWNLTGESAISGNFTASYGGTVNLKGELTRYTNGVTYADDISMAGFEAASFDISNSSTINIYEYAIVKGIVNLSEAGNFKVHQGGIFEGTMNIGSEPGTQAVATFNTGATVRGEVKLNTSGRLVINHLDSISSSLTLQGDSLDLQFTYANGQPVLSLLHGAALNINSTSTINMITPSAFTDGTYLLMTTTGGINWADDAQLIVAGNMSSTGNTRQISTITKGTGTDGQSINNLYLNVTGEAGTLSWSGDSGVWALKNSVGWSGNDDNNFYNADSVIFAQNDTVSRTINISSDVIPALITVSNGNYNFVSSASGKIVDYSALLVTGGSLDMAGANTYMGGTIVTGGSLTAAAGALGTGALLIDGGNVSLVGAHTVSATTLQQGSLSLNTATLTNEVLLKGGTLNLTGTNSVTNLKIANGTEVNITDGASAGSLTGTMSVSGKVNYSASGTASTGTINISSTGDFSMSSSGRTGATINNSGNVTLTGSTAGIINMLAGSSLNANNSNTVNTLRITGAGTIHGNGSLNISTLAINGGGALIINGTNNITASSLALANNTTIKTGSALADDAVVNITPGGNLNISGGSGGWTVNLGDANSKGTLNIGANLIASWGNGNGGMLRVNQNVIANGFIISTAGGTSHFDVAAQKSLTIKTWGNHANKGGLATKLGAGDLIINSLTTGGEANTSLTLTGGRLIFDITSGTSTLGGVGMRTVIANTAGTQVVKRGAGTLVMSSANDISSELLMEAGTLNVTGVNALGSGKFSATGGTTTITASQRMSEVSLSNGAIVNSNISASLGTGKVYVSGAGTRLNMNSSSNLSQLHITDHGLVQMNNVSFGTASVHFDGGTLVAGFSTSFTNTIYLGANGGTITNLSSFTMGNTLNMSDTDIGALNFSGTALTLSNGLNVNFSEGTAQGTYTLLSANSININDISSFVVTGLGARQSLSWNNTGTSLQANILGETNVELSWKGESGTWGNAQTTDSTWDANMQLGSYHFYNRDAVKIGTDSDTAASGGTITLVSDVSPRGTIDISGAGSWTLTAQNGEKIVGDASILKTGSGTLTLGMTNSFSGGVSMRAGTLNLEAAGAAGTGVLAILGGTVNANTALSANTSSRINLNGGTLNANVANSLGLTNVHLMAGTLNMGVNNALGTIAGNKSTLTFTGGTLVYGSGVTTDISSQISSNSTHVRVNIGSNNVTWASGAWGTTSNTLTVNGNSGGKLLLGWTGANNMGPQTLIINGGTVQLNTAKALRNSGKRITSNVIIKEGTFAYSGSGGSEGTDNTGLARPAYVFTETLVFDLNAGATASVTGGDSYGFGSVNEVMLWYKASNNAGTATFAANITHTDTYWSTAHREIRVEDSTGTDIELHMTGRFGDVSNALEGRHLIVIKSGEGTFRLSGTNYSPGWDVAEGTLIADNTQALGMNNALSNTLTVRSAGTVDLWKNNTISILNGDAGALITNTQATATTLTVGRGGATNSYYAGSISGNMGLTVNVATDNQVILAGENSYTGTTRITNGILVLVEDGCLGNNAIINNGSLVFAREKDLTINQQMSGTGQVILPVYSYAPYNDSNDVRMVNTGVLTLSGNNSYSGGTTVSLGKIVAGQANAFGTGAINISGGTVDMGGFGVANTVDFYGGFMENYGSYRGQVNVVANTLQLDTSFQSALNLSAAGTVSFTGVATQESSALFTLTALNNGGAIYFDLNGTEWREGSYTIMSVSGVQDWGAITANMAGLDSDYVWSWDRSIAGLLKITISTVDENIDIKYLDTHAAHESEYRNVLASGSLYVGNGVNTSIYGSFISGAVHVAGGNLTLNHAVGSPISIAAQVSVSGDGAQLHVAGGGATFSDAKGKIVAQTGSADAITILGVAGTIEQASLCGADAAGVAKLLDYVGNARIILGDGHSELKNITFNADSYLDATGAAQKNVTLSGDIIGKDKIANMIVLGSNSPNAHMLQEASLQNIALVVSAGRSMGMAEASFDAASSLTIRNSSNVNILAGDASSMNGSLYLNSGGQFTINNGASFNVGAALMEINGTFTNNGTLNFTSTGLQRTGGTSIINNGLIDANQHYSLAELGSILGTIGLNGNIIDWASAKAGETAPTISSNVTFMPSDGVNRTAQIGTISKSGIVNAKNGVTVSIAGNLTGLLSFSEIGGVAKAATANTVTTLAFDSSSLVRFRNSSNLLVGTIKALTTSGASMSGNYEMSLLDNDSIKLSGTYTNLALEMGQAIKVNVGGAGKAETMTLGAGSSLTHLAGASGSTLHVKNQGTFVNQGTLQFSSTIYQGGVMNNQATIDASYGINVQHGAKLINSGTINSSVTLNSGASFSNMGTVNTAMNVVSGACISGGGTWANDISVASGASFIMGQSIATGGLQVADHSISSGHLSFESGATLSFGMKGSNDADYSQLFLNSASSNFTLGAGANLAFDIDQSYFASVAGTSVHYNFISLTNKDVTLGGNSFDLSNSTGLNAANDWLANSDHYNTLFTSTNPFALFNGYDASLSNLAFALIDGKYVLQTSIDYSYTQMSFYWKGDSSQLEAENAWYIGSYGSNKSGTFEDNREVHFTAAASNKSVAITNNIIASIKVDSGAYTFTGTGSITGESSLSINGGSLTLNNGMNTYTGTTSIAAGAALTVQGKATLGTGSIVNAGTLNFGQSGTLSLTQVISGSGSLVQNGAGTTVLRGANTYTGGTTITSGILEVTSANALGTGTVSFNGGTLRYGASLTADLSSRINAAGLSASNRAKIDLNGNSLTWATAANWLALSNSSAKASTLTYSAASSERNFNIGSNVTLRATASNGAAGISVAKAMSLSGAGKLITANTDNAFFVIGSLSGFTGTIERGQTHASSSLMFAASNSAADRFDLNTGTINNNAQAVLIGNGEGGFASGATLYIRNLSGNASFSTSYASNTNRKLDVEMTQDCVFNGNFHAASGSGDARWGTISFGSATGSNHQMTWTGQGLSASTTAYGSIGTNANILIKDRTTLEFATNSAGNSGGQWADEINIEAGGTLQFNRTDLTGFVQRASGNVIAGAGNVRIIAGSATLTANNTYTGKTIVDGGTLHANAANALGRGVLTVNAGVVNIAAAQTISSVSMCGGSINLTGAGNLGTGAVVMTGGNINFTAANGASSYANAFSGTGSFDMLANGMLNFTGTSDFTNITINVDLFGLDYGSYTILTHSGISNDDFAHINFLNLGDRNVAWSSLVENSLRFTLSDASALYWKGTQSDWTESNAWGLGSTGGTATSYKDGEATYFGIAAQGDKNVTLSSAINSDVYILGGDYSFSGTGTLTGTSKINISAGSLILNNGENDFSGGISIAFNSSLSLAGTSSLGTGDIDNAGTLILAQTGSSTLSQLISGSGEIVHTSTGKTVLSGANTYTGGTTISAGTLEIAHANALGTGPLVMDGGTLAANSSYQLTGLASSISSGSIAKFEVGLGATLTVNEALMRSVSLSGAGTLKATGSSGSYNMAAVDSSSTIQLSTTGTTSLTSLSGEGKIELAAASRGQTVILSGNGSGFAGDLHVAMSGQINIQSRTALGNGTLWMDMGSSSAGQNMWVDSGLSNLANQIQGNFGVEADKFGYFGGVGGHYFEGKILGEGTLSMRDNAGNFTYFLTGDLTGFAGTLTASLNTQTWILGASNSTNSGNLFAEGARLNALGKFSLNYANDVTLNAILSGSNTIIKQNTNTLSISQDNSSYSGAVTISNGSLKLIDSGNLGMGSVINNATFEIAKTQDTSMSGLISGSGKVVQSGTGKTTLTAANTYTGGTQITAGTLALSGAGRMGIGAVTMHNGSTLDLTQLNTASTISNSISGTGIFEMAANGAINFTGAANDFSGITLNVDLSAIEFGTYTILNASGVSTSNFLSINFLGLENRDINWVSSTNSFTFTIIDASGLYWKGTQSDWSSTGAWGVGSVGGAASDYVSGKTAYFSSMAQGDKSVVLSSSITSEVYITGDDYNFAGTGKLTGVSSISVLAGSLTLNGGDYDYSGSTTIISGATLILTGNASLSESRISNEGTLVINKSSDNTFGNEITGSGEVLYTGAGTTTLTTEQAYLGNTNVSAGVVLANAKNALGLGEVTVSGGKLVLSNQHNMSSTTVQIGGVLELNQAQISNEIKLENGGILSLVNANTASSLSLGNNVSINGTGSLNLGSLSMSNGTTIELGAVDITTNFEFKNNITLKTSSDLSANDRASIYTTSSEKVQISGDEGGWTLNFGDGNSKGLLDINFAVVAGWGDSRLNVLQDTRLGAYSLSSAGGSHTINIAAGKSLSIQSLGNHQNWDNYLNKTGAGDLIINALDNSYGDDREGRLDILTVSEGRVVFDLATSQNLGGVALKTVTGAGDLVKRGSATLNMMAANSYTGTTLIEAGKLALGHVDALGSSTVSLQGGTLDLLDLAISNTINYMGGALENYGNFGGELNLNSNGLTLEYSMSDAQLNLSNGITLNFNAALCVINGDALFSLEGLNNNGSLFFDFGAGFTTEVGTYTLLTQTTGADAVWNLGENAWSHNLSLGTDLQASWNNSNGQLQLVLSLLPGIVPEGNDKEVSSPESESYTRVGGLLEVTGEGSATLSGVVTATGKIEASGSSASVDIVGKGIVAANIAGKVIASDGASIKVDGAGADITENGSIGISLNDKLVIETKGGLVKAGIFSSSEELNSASLSNYEGSANLIVQEGDANIQGVVLTSTASLDATGAQNNNVTLSGLIEGKGEIANELKLGSTNSAATHAISKAELKNVIIQLTEGSTLNISDTLIADGTKIKAQAAEKLLLGAGITIESTGTTRKEASSVELFRTAQETSSTLVDSEICVHFDIIESGTAIITDGASFTLDLSKLASADWLDLLATMSLAQNAGLIYSIAFDISEYMLFDLDATASINITGVEGYRFSFDIEGTKNTDYINQTSGIIYAMYIPEPTTSTLTLLGLVSLALRRKRKAN